MLDRAKLTPERLRGPRFTRALQLARALIVGAGATLVDFAVLTVCIRIFAIEPVFARIPALIAGASFQFFGHRQFTFRATSGALSRQAKLFTGVELVGLCVNLWIYAFLVARIHVLPPETLGFVSSFVVFVGFAYPMHRLVSFAVPGAACSQSR
jgi:putative flippase GtrA